MPRKTRTYESDTIAVSFDVKRCIHARECVRRLPTVFDVQKRPWVDPSLGTSDEIAEVVMRCPTGALQYRRKDGGAAEVSLPLNEVTIQPDGPLYVRGDLEIHTPDGVEHVTRAALCRCGASHNKPYCDNSHLDIAFRADAGFSSEDAPVDEGSPAILVVKPQSDGPVLLEGPLVLKSGDGGEALRCAGQVWACRCGKSMNKPYCDGSHSRTGFEAK